MKKRSLFSLILYLAVLALAFSWILGLFSGGTDGLSFSQVVALFQKEQVKSFVVEEDTITLTLHNPYNGKTKLVCSLADPESFRQEMWDTIQSQTASGVLESYDFVPEKGFSAYDLILPLLIVGGVLLIVWVLLMGRMNNGNAMSNFGKARTVLGVPDGKKVTFDDVAGADEEKEELQ